MLEENKVLRMLNGASSEQMQIVHVDDVEIDERTPDPEGRESVEDLRQAIRAMGGIQQFIFAIRLAGRLKIISGGRRLRAARLEGCTHIPVVLVDIPEQDVLLFIIASNAHRWKTWRQLAEEYWTLDVYFKELKKVDPTVTGRFRPWAAKEFKVGEITLQKVLRIHDEEPELLDAVDQGLLTPNAAYQKLQSSKGGGKKRRGRNPPPPVPIQPQAKPTVWESPYANYFDTEPQDAEHQDEPQYAEHQDVTGNTTAVNFEPLSSTKTRKVNWWSKLCIALQRWWRWLLRCISGWFQKPAQRGRGHVLPNDPPAQLAEDTNLGGHSDFEREEAA